MTGDDEVKMMQKEGTDFRHCSDVSPDRLRKTTKNLQTETRTGHLPKINQKRYCFSQVIS
jgi:hypothetical protein